MRTQTYTWLAFASNGFELKGHHCPEPLPVAAQFEEQVLARTERVKERVLAKPGGFDGPRAVIYNWSADAGELTLRTGYRSYCQGLALKEVIAEQSTAAGVRQACGRLYPALLWGSALACVVLLPQGRILLGQRSPYLAVRPGEWTCWMTEVLEPNDIREEGMAGLPERLLREELPAFAGLADARIHGLLVKDNHTTQLVGVLDLRPAAHAEVARALAALAPDAETVNWAWPTLAEAVAQCSSEDAALLADVARRLGAGSSLAD